MHVDLWHVARKLDMLEKFSFVDFGKRVLTCINTLVIDIKWATESGYEGTLFHNCTDIQMLFKVGINVLE